VTGTSRARLATITAAAGYLPSLLSLIAETTLPRSQAGEQLDDLEIEQIAQAVEVLSSGHTAENLGASPSAGSADGCAWRERFWAQTLRTANFRYAHPERYGLSPCESDPTRLAQHADPQPDPPLHNLERRCT
jgi:hypothetical protein